MMELKLCPFCGTKPYLHSYPSCSGKTHHRVNCNECSAGIPATDDPEYAVRRWNMRAGNKWISVKDRLPDEHNIVILVISGMLSEIPYVALFVEGKFRNLEQIDLVFNFPKWWMPLPGLPEFDNA